APASRSTPPSWSPARRHRQGYRRLCRRAPAARAACEELCRLVVVKLWSHFRRALSHAVYAKVPSYNRRQYDHRLAGPPHLPTKPRGGAAWRALTIVSERSLHHSLPLPKGGWVRVLPDEIRLSGKSEARPRAGINGSAVTTTRIRKRVEDMLRRVDLFRTIASSCSHDTRHTV